MHQDGSVTGWIEQRKSRCEPAATELRNRFYARLIGLARRKLRGAPRRAADEDDVVLSAFETFFRRAQEGQFPQLHDRHDLRQQLVKITERKALNQLRHQGRVKRGGGKVRGESLFFRPDTSSAPASIDFVPSVQPTAEFASIVAEGLRGLLDQPGDEELRQIALLRMEGWTNEEIAQRIDRSLPTVERRLRLIRDKWKAQSS
jgi:DNA-directed RNA polymerase specialized sigma24 family protein